MVWVVWVFLRIIILALLQRCRIHSGIWICCSRVLQIIFEWAPALNIPPIQKSLSLKQTLKPVLRNQKGVVICFISHKLQFTILVIAKTYSFWISQFILFLIFFKILHLKYASYLKGFGQFETNFALQLLLFSFLSASQSVQHSLPV